MYCKLYFVWYIIYWKYSVACPSTKSLGSRRVWAQSWSVLGPWTRSCCSLGAGTGLWRGDQAQSRTVSVQASKTDTVLVSVRTLIWASKSLGPGLGPKILGIAHVWTNKNMIYWFKFFKFFLFEIILFVTDVGTDLFSAVDYGLKNDWYWAIATGVCILLPSIPNFSLFLRKKLRSTGEMLGAKYFAFSSFCFGSCHFLSSLCAQPSAAIFRQVFLFNTTEQSNSYLIIQISGC